MSPRPPVPPVDIDDAVKRGQLLEKRADLLTRQMRDRRRQGAIPSRAERNRALFEVYDALNDLSAEIEHALERVRRAGRRKPLEEDAQAQHGLALLTEQLAAIVDRLEASFSILEEIAAPDGDPAEAAE